MPGRQCTGNHRPPKVPLKGCFLPVKVGADWSDPLEIEKGWWKLWWSETVLGIPITNDRVFTSSCSKEKVNKTSTLSRGQTFIYLGHWFRDPTKVSLITKGSRNQRRKSKGTGARHPYVPKDELLEKRTFLAEQGAFTGTQVKK